MIPGLGLLRKLVFLLLLLAVLFVGANIWAERVAEGRIAGVIRDRFDLEQDPSVDIAGFPVLIKVLTGDVPDVTFTALEVEVEGLRLSTVRVELHDIEIEGSLLSGEPSFTVGRGLVEASVDDADLTRFVRRRGERATVRLVAGGAVVRTRRVILGAERDIRAVARVSFADGVLSVDPIEVTVDGERPPPPIEAEAKREATIREEIPTLPGGIEVTSIAAREGALVLRARVRNYRLSVS